MSVSAQLHRPQIVGLFCLVATTVGWGLNWPLMKLLIQEWPPLTARGLSGMVGAALLFAIAALRGEALRVPRGQWGRLLVSAQLNVGGWMGLATLSLLWLDAGEGAIVSYTMPVWASLFAWPLLGERLSVRRLVALALGIAGVVLLVGGHGLDVGLAKLPGVAIGLGAALSFALGTILAKRLPLMMPPITSVAWVILLGALPILLVGLLFERPDLLGLSLSGWGILFYMGVLPFGLCYVTWFAALRRLAASAATIGTLLVPMVGVLVAAVLLGEPLGLREVGALALTLGGIALAVRR